ncbi:hypothetical protein DRQ53_13235 [bacterium]|nr:MAG: hypothetical protein DRQ53_13235 [bacterium]
MKYLILTLCLLMLVACGSDSPTDPGDGGGGSVFKDTPEIPRPSSPGGSIPLMSDVLTVVSGRSLQRFAPRVTDVPIATGMIRARAVNTCLWTVIEEVAGRQLSTWSGPVSVASVCGLNIMSTVIDRSALHPREHPVLRVAGVWQFNISRASRHPNILPTGSNGYVEMSLVAASVPDRDPHIRRDRFWRLHPIEGGVGDFLLLQGPVDGEVVTSQTTGTSRTDTETFGRSVTGEVSLGLGPLSASVSATLSESFETSLQIAEESTEEFKRTVRGEEGKYVQFVVWDLVEIYSITDADGEPFTADGWSFVDDKLERKVATALNATTFPAN